MILLADWSTANTTCAFKPKPYFIIIWSIVTNYSHMSWRRVRSQTVQLIMSLTGHLRIQRALQGYAQIPIYVVNYNKLVARGLQAHMQH